MASNNFVVASLPAYVEQNKDLLLKNFGLVGTDTRRRGITIQTGIKTSDYINYIEIDPELADGSTCGFQAQGTMSLTQRKIDTKAIKVNMDVCDKTLLGKYPEYLLRITASGNDLPFEQFIVDGILAKINKKIEKLIWQGDTSQSGDNDLKWIDGWLEIAKDESDVVDVSVDSGSSAYAGLLNVYMAMPEEVLEREPRIFVSPAIYRAFLQEMVSLNLYHYAGPSDNSFPEEFFLPGSNCRVVYTPGLSGKLQVVGTFARNMVYGCDIEGATEDIKIWYSDDDELFKIKVLWNSGVQFAFPNLVVLGTFAAKPVSPSTQSANLAAIAASVANLDSASKVFKTKEQA